MKRLILFIPFMALMWGCANTSNKLDTPEISNTQDREKFVWIGMATELIPRRQLMI